MSTEHDTQTAEVTFGYWLQDISYPPLGGRRSREVLMVVRRSSGRFVLMRKRSYPRDAYRLPTGGIKPGESALDALVREVHEETNLKVNIDRYLAVLKYYATGARQPLFTSHAFLVSEQSGEFGTNDEDEGIDSWREVDEEGILDHARVLEQLGEAERPGVSWKGWGRFRALGHRLVYQMIAAPPRNGERPEWPPGYLCGTDGFAEIRHDPAPQ